MASAERVLQLRDVPGRNAQRRLLAMLDDADALLARRLRSWRGTGRFTEASAVAYQAHGRAVSAVISRRLGILNGAVADHAIANGTEHAVRVMERLERSFSGSARPLAVREAGVLAGVNGRTRASMIRQRVTSWDRYGQAMTKKIERTIGAGLLAGLTHEEMIDSLVGIRGPRRDVSLRSTVDANGNVLRLDVRDIPEGLFVRYRSWAERIVRTEVSHAYNESRLQTLYETRDRDFPDLKKKILATFDPRTAPDSIAVHGQTRALEEVFVDGAGRAYQRPPGRPNDRETTIPWRSSWPEVSDSRPEPARTRARARREAAGVLEAPPAARAAPRVPEPRGERIPAPPRAPAPARVSAPTINASELAPRIQTWARTEAPNADMAARFTMASTREIATALGMSPRRAYAAMNELVRTHPSVFSRNEQRVNLETGAGQRKRSVGWQLWDIAHGGPAAAPPIATPAPATSMERSARLRDRARVLRLEREAAEKARAAARRS
jgi:hypothetical protein